MSSSSGGLGELSMFDLFRLEVEAQVASLSNELLSIDDNSALDSQLETLMRAAHSLKGAARMVSVEPIVEISHVMEDVFVAAQKGEVSLTANDIDVLLLAIDQIVLISNIPEKEIAEWAESNKKVVLGVVDSLIKILSSDKHDDNPVDDKSDVSLPHLPPVTSESVLVSEKTESIDDRALKVSAERMSKILGLSSEMLVEARGLGRFKDSLHTIKRQQNGLFSLLEEWRELMIDNNLIDNDAHKNSLIQFDECRQSIAGQVNLMDEYERKSNNLANKLYNEVAGSRMRPFEDGTDGLKGWFVIFLAH